MSIKVVDSIMGSGKTQAVIRFLKEHPDEKVFYVTPYLDEIQRIRDPEIGCGPERILEPKLSYDSESNTSRKYNNVVALMQRGKSVATTHAMFLGHPEEVLNLIRDEGYILIVDESLELLRKNMFVARDIDIAIREGLIVPDETGGYISSGEPYDGLLKPIQDFAATSRLYRVEPNGGGKQVSFYWSSICEAITGAKEVYVLTYMFEFQDLWYYFAMNGIPYEYAGVRMLRRPERGRQGEFEFSSLSDSTTPDFVGELGRHVHFARERIRGPKLYDFQGRWNSKPLSMSWFSNPKNEDAVKHLASNGLSFFTYIDGGCAPGQRMWGSYLSGAMDVPTERSLAQAEKKNSRKLGGAAKTICDISGNVHSRKNFCTFNQRASNAYRDRTHLAYYCNLFASPNKRNFVKSFGLKYDEDGYALSTALQWMWRSAIRDGQDITVYMPSDRMRHLVTDWVNHPYIAKEKFAGRQ